MIIKKILLITFLILILFSCTGLALAQEEIIPFPQPKGTVNASLPDIFVKIINLALYVVGGVAVFFLIIGGFQFILAAGNPDGVQKAKGTVLYVVIGLAIVILSNVIVQFIIQKLSA